MVDDVPNRDRIFAFLVEYKRQHDGLSPSVAGIARGCMLHPSTIQYHLLRLETEGRIRIRGRRSIEVIGGSWEAPEDEEENAPGDESDGASHGTA